MTLLTIRNNILRFVPGLNPAVVESIIQDSYSQLASMEWRRLRTIRHITTTPPYSTGLITVSSTGVVTPYDGATFDSSFVGRFLRVYYPNTYFEIISYSAPTLTIRDWTGLNLSTPTPYTIFRTTYSIPSSIKLIYEITSSYPLKKKSLAFFNSTDPSRSNFGEPLYWAYASLSDSNSPTIELYPIPDSAYPLRIVGKLATPPLSSTDTPLLPITLIENYALMQCYRLKDQLEPNQGWQVRLSEQTALYQSLLSSAQEEDYLLYSFPDKVKDKLGERLSLSDEDFWVSHDDLAD